MAVTSNPQHVIGIAADDLTGANDSLVQFARAGWTSRLALGALDAQRGRSALATVTDSRALTPEHADAVTGDAVDKLMVAGADRLYVKIDSTMRGSVPGQIDGALRAWRVRHDGAFAVVCPAYPAMGRTVSQGHLHVNGKPVESTSVGRDPVTPVRTSDLQRLIPGSVSVQLGDNTVAEHAHQLAKAAGSAGTTVVVDGTTDGDLGRLAAALAELGPWAVPVGSAGLAAALASRWGSDAGLSGRAHSPGDPAERVLIVVSSLHDISRAQADQLVTQSISGNLLVLQPSLDDVQDRDSAVDWAKTQDLAGPHRVTLLLSPTDRGASDRNTSDAGTPGPKLSGADIADSLAAITGAILRQTVGESSGMTALVLMGGDGARAVLRETGAHSILVTGTLQEGVPLGVIDGGTANGLHVVTKAGGFGTPDSLVDIVHQLCNPSPSSTEALP